MAYKDDAKAFFETGDKPTQGQFATVFDNLRWNDQFVPLNKVTGLQDALDLKANLNLVRPEEMVLDGDTEFLMPAKYKLEGLAAKNIAGIDITLTFSWVELSIDSDPLEMLVPAGGVADLEVGKTFWTDTMVSVTGFAGLPVHTANPITLLIFRK